MFKSLRTFPAALKKATTGGQFIMSSNKARFFSSTGGSLSFALINKQELETLLKEKQADKDFILIDVRQPEEFKSADLPPIDKSAHNIPVSDVGPAFQSLDNKSFKQTYGTCVVFR